MFKGRMVSAFRDASSMEGLGHCLADSLLENKFRYVSSINSEP